jgi:(p)ppGpp synthase/HD superfamily hydrolase
MNLLELANRIASNAFDKKKDKAGEPYTKHLYRVRDSVDGCYGDKQKICAVLHDLLEDCPEWNYQILEQLFDKEIADTVQLLTHDNSDDYFAYVRRIKNSGNGFAITIKIADLKDNMNITRFKDTLSDKDLARLKKYHTAYSLLTN